MDAVGLTVGVIGLAGLFSTCLDLVDKIDDYRHFKDDSKALTVQFASHRIRFEKWGTALGLSQAFENLSHETHEVLADQVLLNNVHDILQLIQDICNEKDAATLKQASGGKGLVSTGGVIRPAAKGLIEPFRVVTASKRHKIGWALRGKIKKEAQVELFGKLVERLYQLVPVEGLSQKTTITTEPQIPTEFQEELAEKAWMSEIKNILKQIELEVQADIRKDLQAWLVKYPPNEIWDEAVQNRLNNTCDWIIHRYQFTTWLSLQQESKKAKMLWINGPPGFGKTVLCARLVEYLSTTITTPVAHFFFSSDFQSRDDPYEALRSWISQIVSLDSVAFDHVRARRESQNEEVATRKTVLELFREIVQLVPGCVFVMDGLDECTWLDSRSSSTRGESIVSFLERLGQAIENSKTRVLICSRDELEIRSGIESMDATIFEYKITPDDVDSDTKLYARSIVDRKLAKKSEGLKTLISQRMAEQCEGQFLWLRLQEDSLRSWKNQKQLEDALDKTPSGLEKLYHRTWTKISQLPEEERDRAFSLLRWAAFALRPLTVCEITEAVLINLDGDEFPIEEMPDSFEDDYINNEILGVCGALINVRKDATNNDPGLRTVRLVHFSVKQYFLSYGTSVGHGLQVSEKLRSLNERVEHTTLASHCLRYIHYEHVWQNGYEDMSSPVPASLKDYAAGSWHLHVQLGDLRSSTVTEFIIALFDEDNIIWRNWREWFDASQIAAAQLDNNYESLVLQELSAGFEPPCPVYYASKLNLTETTIGLIQRYKDFIDGRSVVGETALIAACWNGNEDITGALIEAGANIHAQNFRGSSALHIVALGGHLPLMKVLLDRGADPGVTDLRRNTPLHLVALQGHTEMAQLLLSHGADVMARCSDGATALHMSAGLGYTEVARVLLSYGADSMDNETANQQTSLHTAAISGHLETVQLLLETEVDMESSDVHGWTPLISASYFGHYAVSRLLLNKSKNIHQVDHTGRTALHNAAMNGHVEVVQLLLNQGAEVNTKTPDGWTSLQDAAFSGYEETVRVLLQNGADLAVKGSGGFSPLTSAAEMGHRGVVEILLDAGADISAADGESRTPLSAAIMNERTEVVDLLLQRRRDIYEIPISKWLPLTWAAFFGHVAIAKSLLEHGADISNSGLDGTTPLLASTSNNTTEMLQLCLEKGADINTVDNDGNTPLRNAIFLGNTAVVQLLLESGVNLKVPDHQGWWPLNLAASSGHLEMIKLMVEHGANLPETDVDGWTPMHAAADGGHVEVINYFFSKGVDLAARDYSGKSALHLASTRGHVAAVERLLEQSDPAAIDDKDSFERTPLFYAAMRGHEDVVRALLLNSLDINAKDRYGSSALIAAVRNEHTEVVEQLLAISGISISHQDCFEMTAKSWAHKTKNTEVIGLLDKIESGEEVSQNSRNSNFAVENHSAPFAQGAFWCDVCTRCIPAHTPFFECSKCFNGDFLACAECMAAGANCMEDTHQWTVATYRP